MKILVLLLVLLPTSIVTFSQSSKDWCFDSSPGSKASQEEHKMVYENLKDVHKTPNAGNQKVDYVGHKIFDKIYYDTDSEGRVKGRYRVVTGAFKRQKDGKYILWSYNLYEYAVGSTFEKPFLALEVGPYASPPSQPTEGTFKFWRTGKCLLEDEQAWFPSK